MECGEWKYVQLFQVTWPCPYMVKNLKKKHLLRNQEDDDLETWYTALGTRVLPTFIYVDPGLTWPFLWQGWFVSECFYMGKLLLHWVLTYFQVWSNSAYPQYSGERYRALVLWFLYPMTLFPDGSTLLVEKFLFKSFRPNGCMNTC